MTALDKMNATVTEEVDRAFDNLVDALRASCAAAGVDLACVAVSYAMRTDGMIGYNCLFTKGMTPGIAEGLAGILIADGGDYDDLIDDDDTPPPPERKRLQ